MEHSYKEGQTLRLQSEQNGSDLPSEVRITEVIGDKIKILSEKGTYESTPSVLDAFYGVYEDITLENLPEVTAKTLDEIICLFDAYAATQSPLAGIQVKTKLTKLKENIYKVGGVRPSLETLLGKKVA